MRDENLRNVRRKWHITMTTQLLSCQGCSARSSTANKRDPDCCSPSGIIAINPLFSSSHYSPLKLNWPVPWNCTTKKKKKKIDMASSASPTTVQSASKYSKEFLLFMSCRFTQGQQLGPDSLMAEPPFITAEPALWSRLGSHLARRI